MDSNHRMAASKAAALPLGDRPAGNSHNDYLKYGAEGET